MKEAGLMEDIVILEWSFTPPDYFEDEIRIIRDDYEMVIKEGKVEARINPSLYDREPKMRDSLHESLNNQFLGAQLINHKPYDLSKPSMYRFHSDDRKDVTVFLDGVTSSGGTLDFVVQNKDGNLIVDSRKDRIQKKKKLSELAEVYCPKDPLTASLLKSYNAAVNDPENELVHLYEIRDALNKRFGDMQTTCKILSLTESDWKRLGQLANNEPLKQGRHRGKSPGILRDATEDELKEARDIARSFVEAYLVFLDRANI
jgi:hypothetical protein